VRVLVTGADGFVGRHLVRHLLQAGDEVAAGCRPGGRQVDWSVGAPAGARVDVLPLELADAASVRSALGWLPEAVVHLAAIASVRQAQADPGAAWDVNASGTARLVAAAADLRLAGKVDPAVLVVSSGEVYGMGVGVARQEADALQPVSAYAASKVGAETAALEAWRRSGLRVMVARPFGHTGPGQTPDYVVPSWVVRLRAARVSGAGQVQVGNLSPVRDLLDVRDVVGAYRLLLRDGVAGEAYNVARGDGLALAEVFRRLAELMGAAAVPVADPALVRRTDIPHLVGDSTKLRRATGWAPTTSLEQTLQGLVDAEAD
jgi:GDP-4-dehydro-6-deoxy-D-mannose reductase